MTDLRAATDAAMFWAALKDAVAKRYEAARADLKEAMREAGSEKQRARDLDGQPSGVATIAEGRYVAEVVDAKALIEWLRANYPEQLQTVETTAVRPAYLDVILGMAAANAKDVDGPGPVPVDPSTGAVIPGVRAEWKPGDLRVSAEHVAKRKAFNLLQSALEAGAPDSVYSRARQQELEEGSP